MTHCAYCEKQLSPTENEMIQEITANGGTIFRWFCDDDCAGNYYEKETK